MELKAIENNPARSEHMRQVTLGSTARALTLALATLTTGLVAGLFYAYAVSVNPALVEQPEASYVATENAITEKIVNPLRESLPKRETPTKIRGPSGTACARCSPLWRS
jgi:hypothetical protein